MENLISKIFAAMLIIFLIGLLGGCSPSYLEKGDCIKVVDPHNPHFGKTYTVWSNKLLPDRWGLPVYILATNKSESGTTLFYISEVAKCKEVELYKIYDTVYKDYYSNDGWTKNESEAKLFTKLDAEKWIKEFRELELGEYCNTGEKNYPVKIVQ